MSTHEGQARTWRPDATTVDNNAAANAWLDHGLIAPPTAPALVAAAAGEQTGADLAERVVPRASEAEVTRVIDVLHAQADRFMVDAGRMVQQAAATRATAAHQAGDLEWRAD